MGSAAGASGRPPRPDKQGSLNLKQGAGIGSGVRRKSFCFFLPLAPSPLHPLMGAGQSRSGPGKRSF